MQKCFSTVQWPICLLYQSVEGEPEKQKQKDVIEGSEPNISTRRVRNFETQIGFGIAALLHKTVLLFSIFICLLLSTLISLEKKIKTKNLRVLSIIKSLDCKLPKKEKFI